MILLLKTYWIGLACLVLAAAVAIAAIADHHRKQQRINDAQVAAYFCRVQHTNCGAVSWHKIEAEWQTRQIAYEVSVAVLGSLALVFFVIGRRSARGSITTSRRRSER